MLATELRRHDDAASDVLVLCKATDVVGNRNKVQGRSNLTGPGGNHPRRAGVETHDVIDAG